MATTRPNPLIPVKISVTKRISAGLQNYLQNICRVSVGDTSLDSGKGQWVTADTYTKLITDVASSTYIFCVSFFAKNATGKLYILECKPITTPTAKSTVEILEEFINNGGNRMYIYSLNNDIYKAKDAALVTLLTKYTALNASQYFSLDISVGDNVNAADSPWQSYKGLKSVMGFYAATISTQSISGAALGIVASNAFKLSTTVLLNKLQWKSVTGVITPDDTIDPEIASALNSNGCTWVQSLAGLSVLLGASMADGTAFEEYFAVDTILFELQNAATTMFINGANNSNLRVTFDQAGVTRLITTVNSASNNLINIGCLVEFAQGVDDNNNLVGLGEWNSIPFNEWKPSNPDLFEQRIYDGASVIMNTTKFMLQVILNIELI